MIEPRKPSLILPVAVVAVLLLAALYIHGYYAMVESGDWLKFEIDNHYVARDLQRSFFSPIHWLDRRMRPHVWEPTP